MHHETRFVHWVWPCLTFLGCACGDKESPLADLGPVDAEVQASDVAPDHRPLDRRVAPDQSPTGCPDWRCTDADCTELVQMPGPFIPAPAAEAQKYGYILGGEPKYSFVRKDLSKLLAWAVCEVRSKFPSVTPIEIWDMSQKDGKTPGTDVGGLRHPQGTHVAGHDIDIAYYQTDGVNDIQIVCGDGSDLNWNEEPGGKYNDGYFCTTKQNIVDWGPQVWFFARLLEYDKARIFGIDQMLVDNLGAKLKALHDQGEISDKIFQRFNDTIAWGAAGGWAFHFHHTHLSFE